MASTQYSRDVDGGGYDDFWDQPHPRFLTSSSLHRSVGGHGFAFPSWTLPPILYHCPDPYDVTKQKYPEKPSTYDGLYEVRDDLGNSWKLENMNSVVKHRKDMESVQAKSYEALKLIEKLDYEGAAALLTSAYDGLWPCHRPMSLGAWIRLHQGHALFRTAFLAGSSINAKTTMSRALYAFEECIKVGKSNNFDRSVTFSATLGCAWIHFFKGETYKMMECIRCGQGMSLSKAYIQRRADRDLDIPWILLTVYAAMGNLPEAEKYSKGLGCFWYRSEDIQQLGVMIIHLEAVLGGRYISGISWALDHMRKVSPFCGELHGRVHDQITQYFSGMIGDIWFALGVNSEALLAYENSYSPQNFLLRSASLIGQGNVYLRMFQQSHSEEEYNSRRFLDKAERKYKEAQEICEELGYKAGQAIVNCNMGILYQEAGQLDTALIYFKNAKETCLVDSTGVTCRIGQLLFELKERDEALQLLRSITARGKPLFEAWIKHHIGCGLMKQCFPHATNDGGRKVAEHSKQVGEAKDCLIEAVKIFATLQSSLGLMKSLWLTVFEEHKTSYRLLEWCFASEGQPVEAVVWAERSRSRLLMHEKWDDLVSNEHNRTDLGKLGTGEFDKLSYDMAWQLLRKWQSLCSLQQVAVVQYTLCPDYGLLIYVMDGSAKPKVRCLHFGELNEDLASSKKIEVFVNQTVKLISKNEVTSSGEVKSRLAKLYDLLIRPIETHLQRFKQLIIIPQEVLFKVPFVALVRKDNKQLTFLVELYEISVAESLRGLIRSSLLRQMSEMFETTKESTNAALVVGIKDHTALGEETLNCAEIEARGIAKTLERATGRRTTLLLGKEATKEKVVEQLQGNNESPVLVHMATHAVITDKYEEGAILFSLPESFTADGTIDCARVLAWPSSKVGARTAQRNPLRDSVEKVNKSIGLMKHVLIDAKEVARLNLRRTRLVVLSACQTGRGVIVGEGVVGLGRALARSGVPCTVLSLWSVDDKASSRLMEAFYRNLLLPKNGQSRSRWDVARAMRESMVEMIHERSKFNTPRWCVGGWASFMPYGLVTANNNPPLFCRPVAATVSRFMEAYARFSNP